MKKYKLTNTANAKNIGIFATRQDAADAMEQYIASENECYDPTDEEWLTPFDFDLEEVEVKEEINEIVVDYNTAREYLGGKPNKQFTVSKRVAANTVPGLVEVTRLVDALNPNHVEALIALNELFTIAEAWNKADEFVPDFSNGNQDKWFPWFYYNKDAAGFGYAVANSSPSGTSADFGSRLCFKSANRARQFGKQFIDLWNKVLLF